MSTEVATIPQARRSKVPGWVVPVSVLLLALVAVYIVLRKGVRTIVSSSADKRASDPAAPAATAKAFRAAMNPSGFEWLINADGTDEDEIYRLVKNLPTANYWEDVMREYKRLYNSDLVSDLRSELDSEEYQNVNTTLKWLYWARDAGVLKGISGTAQAVQLPKVPTQVEPYTTTGTYVQATEAAPVLDDNLVIVFVSEPGELLGRYAGQRHNMVLVDTPNYGRLLVQQRKATQVIL